MAIRTVLPLPDRSGLMRRIDLIPYLPFAMPTLDRYVREGNFPQPRKLGRSVWFDLDEVRAWMEGTK